MTPPLGSDVCIGETTNLMAQITINATNATDPQLENVSVCANVTCAGGYVKNEKQYVNLSGTLSANIAFTVTPPVPGQCSATVCVDCDDTIPEINETDNCGNVTFDAIDCSKEVPISPFAVLAIIGIITAIAVARIRK